MANDSKSVAHSRCYAIPPPTGVYALPHGKIHIPHISFSSRELATWATRLTGDFPQGAGKRLVLMYASGGLLPIRAWPIASFSHVAVDLIGHGYNVGIIGTPQDKTLAQVIQAHCGSPACLDLTGYTHTVRELLMLFHLAALLLSNDGGPAHVAALTPIPTIVFYGPETPTLYGRVGEQSINLYTPLACSPCLTAYNHRWSPCDGHNVCLTSISPDLVLEKIYTLLEPHRG